MAAMLRVRKLAIDTSQETVAFLSRQCVVYRAEEFLALARIEITGGRQRIVATLNVVDERIHAAFEADFRFAAKLAAEGEGYAIASRA